MVSGGENTGYGLLTVRENLWMFAQFYGIDSKTANSRINRLLEIVGMTDRINTKCSDLSTGLRQKMNIVRGFLTDPEILFLDEPTLGLDVGASRDVRKFIRGWVNEDAGRTILLTTHYMVEADELCDRVAIINKGMVLACDTPASLKRHLRKEAIFNHRCRFTIHPCATKNWKNYRALCAWTCFPQDWSIPPLKWFSRDESVLSSVIAKFDQMGLRIRSLQKREPTLEDVFVALVGARMEEVEHAESPED